MKVSRRVWVVKSARSTGDVNDNEDEFYRKEDLEMC